MYPKGYLEDLQDFARKNNCLICFDEVQAGFYRMGSLYGYQPYGDTLQPDLVCLGKGITSSLPLSAVLGRREIIDIDPEANVSSTHSGNALSCAAALSNIKFLTSSKFQKKFSKTVSEFESRCNKLNDYEIVDKIYYRGMVAGIILENTEQAEKVVDLCIENGVLPVRTSRESIKLGPPLTITSRAIKEAFDVIEAAIEKVEKDGI